MPRISGIRVVEKRSFAGLTEALKFLSSFTKTLWYNTWQSTDSKVRVKNSYGLRFRFEPSRHNADVDWNDLETLAILSSLHKSLGNISCSARTSLSSSWKFRRTRTATMLLRAFCTTWLGVVNRCFGWGLLLPRIEDFLIVCGTGRQLMTSLFWCSLLHLCLSDPQTALGK